MKAHRFISLIFALAVSLAGGFARSQDLGSHFKKLKEGIFVYAQNPADSNATIIVTTEGVVLIDSGHRPPDTVALAHAVKKLTSQPVRYLINTEPHTDHTTYRSLAVFATGTDRCPCRRHRRDEARTQSGAG